MKSLYMLSTSQQINLCVDRGFERLRGDATITISRVVANGILAVIVGELLYSLRKPEADLKGTMFVHLKETTESFNGRSTLIFLAILLNAFASALEVRHTSLQSPSLPQLPSSPQLLPSPQAHSSLQSPVLS